MSYTKRQAITELLFIDVIWGFAFVAMRLGLEGFDSLYLNFLRFGIAAVFSALVIGLGKKFREQINRDDFILAIVPGGLIGLALSLQSYGLVTTSVASSSFITTLYVVMVPAIEVIRRRKMLSMANASSVLIALVGAAILTEFNPALGVNSGDFYTFLCAIAATFHILWIQSHCDKIRSLTIFNFGQFFWGAIVALVCMLFVGVDVRMPALSQFSPWLGVLFLALGATYLALNIEVRAQRVVSAFAASLLYLLEAPIAALFAFFLLGEFLSWWQLFGGALIILSAGLGVFGRESILREVPLPVSYGQKPKRDVA